MIFCTDTVDKNTLLKIVSFFSTTDNITILPFMFTPSGDLRVMCPCCIYDRRTENGEFEFLKQNDSWSALFTKQKFRKHHMATESLKPILTVENGFSVRSVTEFNRRSKYGNVDLPIFKELGFRGYKFDKFIFFPIAVHKIDQKRIRIGIPNPDLFKNQPFLQRVIASWIFRLEQVPPIDFPDILPISMIGKMVLSERLKSRRSYSCEKEILVGSFFDILLQRKDKRLLKKLDIHSVSSTDMKSSPEDCNDTRRTNDTAIEC